MFIELADHTDIEQATKIQRINIEQIARMQYEKATTAIVREDTQQDEPKEVAMIVVQMAYGEAITIPPLVHDIPWHTQLQAWGEPKVVREVWEYLCSMCDAYVGQIEAEDQPRRRLS